MSFAFKRTQFEVMNGCGHFLDDEMFGSGALKEPSVYISLLPFLEYCFFCKEVRRRYSGYRHYCFVHCFLRVGVESLLRREVG